MIEKKGNNAALLAAHAMTESPLAPAEPN